MKNWIFEIASLTLTAGCFTYTGAMKDSNMFAGMLMVALSSISLRWIFRDVK